MSKFSSDLCACVEPGSLTQVLHFTVLHRWLHTVETVGRQYAFIKFGKNIYGGLCDCLTCLAAQTSHLCCLSSPHLASPTLYPATSDRVIQRKRRDYLDPNSSNNMKKLNDDLQSIHNIMRTTINDVLDR